MLARATDRVLLRNGAVLNLRYKTMGLYGSEYWTYVLPRRVGQRAASSLTSDCIPIGADEAERVDLTDRTIVASIPDVERQPPDTPTGCWAPATTPTSWPKSKPPEPSTSRHCPWPSTAATNCPR
jgi:enoyl-CoA hydratase/carnithine racemase